MEITLTDVTSGYNLSKINNNFRILQDAINNRLVHRDGTNELEADLDFNSHKAINVGSIVVDGKDIIEEINNAYDSIEDFLVTTDNLLREIEAILSGQLQDRNQGNGQYSTQLLEDITEGTVYTIPNGLQYIVGRNSLRISYQGVLCYPTYQYDEVGTFDEASNQIKFNITIPAHSHLNIWISGVGNIVQIKEDLEAAFAEYTNYVTTTKSEIESSITEYTGHVNTTKSEIDSSFTDYTKHIDNIKNEAETSFAEYKEYANNTKTEIDSSIADYTKYVNNTKTEIESSITEYTEHIDNTKSEIEASFTEYKEYANNTKSEIDASFTDYKKYVNNTKSEIEAAYTEYANNTKSEIESAYKEYANNTKAEIESAYTEYANNTKAEINASFTEYTGHIDNTKAEIDTSFTEYKEYANNTKSEIAATKSEIESSITEYTNYITNTKTEVEAMKSSVETSEANVTATAVKLEKLNTASLESANNSKAWAEGTDEEVVAIGGEHSSKTWSLLSKEYAEAAEQIKQQIGTPLNVQGRVDDVQSLPASDNKNGDMYFVGPEDSNNLSEYVWINNKWEFLGTLSVSVPDASESEKGIVKLATQNEITNRTGNNVVVASKLPTNIDWSKVDNKPSTVSGYGITDVYTKTEVYNKTEVYPKVDIYTKTEVDSELSGKLGVSEKATSASVADSVSWKGVSGKPETYPPSTHNHEISQINNLQSVLDGKQPVGDYVTESEFQSSLGNKLDVDAKASSSYVSDVANSVSWNVVSDKPTIPTKISQLENDSGYLYSVSWDIIGSKPSTVSGYGITDVYTKEEVYPKADVYTKEEVYNKTEVYPKEEVYSKTEVYPKEDVYTKTEVYNKTEVDTKIDAKESLPSQIGNSGKFLTTDGSVAKWENISGLVFGSTIFSLIPLTEAGLHLLDGSLLNVGGVYNEAITKIAALKSSNPNLFTTEENWQQSVTTYGVCGKFVHTEGVSLRLPKVTGFVEGTLDSGALGDLVEAGLPNIEAKGASHNSSLTSLTGALKEVTSGTSIGGSVGSFTKGFEFNASYSNPIYGNSTTVQPQAIKGYLYIVLATTTKTNVQVNIDNVVTELNGKADKDLSNVPEEGINRSVSWIAPDYSSAINYSSQWGSEISAIDNGWFWVRDNLQSASLIVVINGYQLNIFQNGGSQAGIGGGTFFFVNKNDTIKITGGNGYARNFLFFPCRG